MSYLYTGKVTLIDEQGLKTTLTYDLGTSAGTDPSIEFPAAKNSFDSIVTALAAITTANIFQAAILFRDDTQEDATLPAEAEVPEEAAVSLHIAAAPAPEKYHYIRVPAPVDTLFLADGVTVDSNNAALQAYVAALAAETTVSDGETIVTARGSGGIAAGHLRFKARSTR